MGPSAAGDLSAKTGSRRREWRATVRKLAAMQQAASNPGRGIRPATAECGKNG